jgi:enamine deaminase RidA (YjgF/YER057c/UK114 family)
LEVLTEVDGTEIASLRLPTRSEHHITIPPCGDPNRILRSLAEQRDAVIVSQFVFAGDRLYQKYILSAEQVLWPVVWLRGDSCAGNGIHSIQAVALSGSIPVPVRCGKRNVGYVYEDADARYCRLSGLVPADLNVSRVRQARSAFEAADALLAENGFSFADTVRTWIYLDNLLEWYDDFNVFRTAFFKERAVFDRVVPASTGIGAGNSFGAAINMSVFAVQPKSSEFTVQKVESPLQNSALEYNSAFSRAVELGSPLRRSLLISGTASIAPDGKTVHKDEPEKQIRLTMDAVKAILESRGMHWDNLCRGIAYFKSMDYLPIYNRIAAELNIPRFPLAFSHADVCRHDLIFEIEADAVQSCFT